MAKEILRIEIVVKDSSETEGTPGSKLLSRTYFDPRTIEPKTEEPKTEEPKTVPTVRRIKANAEILLTVHEPKDKKPEFFALATEQLLNKHEVLTIEETGTKVGVRVHVKGCKKA